MWRPDAKLPLDTGDFITVLLLAVPLISNYYTCILPDVILKIKDDWPAISMLQLTALNTGLIVFAGLRPLPDLGYTLCLNLQDFARILAGVILASTILLPLGYLTHSFTLPVTLFHAFPLTSGFILGLAKFCTVIILVSLPQEILFRGVIQNLLHSRFEASSAISKYTTEGGSSYELPSALNVTSYPSYSAVGQDIEDLDAECSDHKIYAKQRTYGDVHSSFFKRGVCCWFLIPTLRDWAVLFLTSIIFAIAVTDHRRWGDGCGLAFGMAMTLGIACGYTWRLTSKVTASALVHAIVLYVGLDFLGTNIDLTLAGGSPCPR